MGISSVAGRGRGRGSTYDVGDDEELDYPRHCVRQRGMGSVRERVMQAGEERCMGASVSLTSG